MAKKFYKSIIIILLFAMLFVMFLSKSVNAKEDKRLTNSAYKTRGDLIAAGEGAVGKKVWIRTKKRCNSAIRKFSFNILYKT